MLDLLHHGNRKSYPEQKETATAGQWRNKRAFRNRAKNCSCIVGWLKEGTKLFQLYILWREDTLQMQKAVRGCGHHAYFLFEQNVNFMTLKYFYLHIFIYVKSIESINTFDPLSIYNIKHSFKKNLSLINLINFSIFRVIFHTFYFDLNRIKVLCLISIK